MHKPNKLFLVAVAISLISTAVFAGGANDKNASVNTPLTYKDLQTAVQGETNARQKYIDFAAKAAEEGNKNTQKLFLTAADAELIHITKEYEIANAMKAWTKPAPDVVEVSSSDKNLESCVAGEKYESEEMYPAMVINAQKEQVSEAEQIFAFARDAEASHAVLFAEELNLMKTNSLPQEEVYYYLCPVCGRIEKSSAPGSCPICGVPGSMFKKY